MTYSTPDAVIRAALAPTSIGIDYAKVAGGRYDAEMHDLLRGHVQGTLAQLSPQEWAIVVASAHLLSYREIARRMGLSDRTVRRLHRPAWERVARRFRQLGLIHSEAA